LNAQPRLQTDTELCAIALPGLELHDCSLISPASRSEWKDRNAKTEGRAEGEIEGGGTRRSCKGGLHRDWRGTRGRWQRAAMAWAHPQMLAPERAVFACLRCLLLENA
jgi:hypothetical protein